VPLTRGFDKLSITNLSWRRCGILARDRDGVFMRTGVIRFQVSREIALDALLGLGHACCFELTRCAFGSALPFRWRPPRGHCALIGEPGSQCINESVKCFAGRDPALSHANRFKANTSAVWRLRAVNAKRRGTTNTHGKPWTHVAPRLDAFDSRIQSVSYTKSSAAN